LEELCGEIPLFQTWKKVEAIEFDDLLVAIASLDSDLWIPPH
jgi:hypothetical protein